MRVKFLAQGNNDQQPFLTLVFANYESDRHYYCATSPDTYLMTI